MSRINARFNRLFQYLTRESEDPSVPCALWCRRCCQVIIRQGDEQLQETGYAHLREHDQSAALMRIKALNIAAIKGE